MSIEYLLDKLDIKKMSEVELLEEHKNIYQEFMNTHTNIFKNKITYTRESLTTAHIAIEKELDLRTKKIYNECVEISDTEYQTLIERYETEERLKKGIEILNNYLMTSGKKYKSHYHVLIGWVLVRVNENEKSKRYGLPSND